MVAMDREENPSFLVLDGIKGPLPIIEGKEVFVNSTTSADWVKRDREANELVFDTEFLRPISVHEYQNPAIIKDEARFEWFRTLTSSCHVCIRKGSYDDFDKLKASGCTLADSVQAMAKHAGRQELTAHGISMRYAYSLQCKEWDKVTWFLHSPCNPKGCVPFEEFEMDLEEWTDFFVTYNSRTEYVHSYSRLGYTNGPRREQTLAERFQVVKEEEGEASPEAAQVSKRWDCRVSQVPALWRALGKKAGKLGSWDVGMEVLLMQYTESGVEQAKSVGRGMWTLKSRRGMKVYLEPHC
ncbi:hypothetical protein IAR50_006148 [Cryptococcus sp. DSM 104548]